MSSDDKPNPKNRNASKRRQQKLKQAKKWHKEKRPGPADKSEPQVFTETLIAANAAEDNTAAKQTKKSGWGRWLTIGMVVVGLSLATAGHMLALGAMANPISLAVTAVVGSLMMGMFVFSAFKTTDHHSVLFGFGAMSLVIGIGVLAFPGSVVALGIASLIGIVVGVGGGLLHEHQHGQKSHPMNLAMIKQKIGIGIGAMVVVGTGLTLVKVAHLIGIAAHPVGLILMSIVAVLMIGIAGFTALRSAKHRGLLLMYGLMSAGAGIGLLIFPHSMLAVGLMTVAGMVIGAIANKLNMHLMKKAKVANEGAIYDPHNDTPQLDTKADDLQAAKASLQRPGEAVPANQLDHTKQESKDTDRYAQYQQQTGAVPPAPRRPKPNDHNTDDNEREGERGIHP